MIDLKVHKEEVIKENENLSTQLQDREAYCENLKNELAYLICDIKKKNNQLS